MASYPSLYRAKATRWTGTSLQVLIPQVFGEAVVYVTDYLNDPTTGMGWVMFQGGNCEFPVWLGPLGATGTPTSGVGGGEGVYIGTDPPSGPQELWYDTDEPDVPVTYPSWAALSLLNNFTNQITVAYRKVGDDVEVRGLVSNSVAFSTNGGYAIGNLPVGYRPPATTMFPCMGTFSPATTPFAQRVDVQTGGNIMFYVYAAGTLTNMSLDTIRFSVTA